MQKSIKKVALIARQKKTSVIDTLADLVDYLKAKEIDFVLDQVTADSLPQCQLPTCETNKLGQNADLLIVIGGDGSLLNAAHDVMEQDIPVIGINRGALGFLTDINPTEFSEQLDDILAGQYFEESRFLLNASVINNDLTIAQDSALNEVTILPGESPHMIRYSIFVDEQFLCTQQSDGLIISTPTGSTAYALSGGGPILHPELNAIVMVPMFPHSLTNRPIVIDGNHEITIKIEHDENNINPRLCCDGKSHIDIPSKTCISIMKKPKPLRLIHPLDYDYYNALRSKLYWNKSIVDN